MSVTENLIEIVKQHQILFDLSHEDFKNVRKKDKVWELIGVELNETGDEVKRRWNNLRDSYMRVLKANKTKTGQAAKSGKKWQWSAQMDFFRSFAKTSSNISELANPVEEEETYSEPQNADKIESNSESDLHHSESATNIKSTPIPKRTQKKESKPIRSVDSLVNYFENKRKREHDGVDLWFLAQAQTVKIFSKKRQAMVKMELAQIILNHELQHIEEQTALQDQSISFFHPISTTGSTNSINSPSPTPTPNPTPSPSFIIMDMDSQHTMEATATELNTPTPTDHPNSDARKYYGTFRP